MRLKTLEMAGFKSFTGKTSLHFTPGITAIVGPNGCGKSNIVDALRWVMGEQSARHLRGHHMEDVIFNGSDSLPATGMAEVSLIFDNEDGGGPPEYSGFSEIMITRRLFRSGEAEYLINKVVCRLKDIIDLFLGTGVGNKAYSVVEQGRVEEIVNAKPEDRRALIEEAAGTSKYKSRKVAAERKLERTQQNLLRVNDIVREIERQIRSLEQQARKAERYKALREELKEKEIRVAGHQRAGLERQLAEEEKLLTQIDDRLVAALASLHGRESESEAIRLALIDLEKEIARAQEAFYQQKVVIQAEEQKIGFYQKDLVDLEATTQKLHTELAEMGEKERGVSGEIDSLQASRQQFVQLSLFEEAYLGEKERELTELKRRIQALQSELESERQALVEISGQIAHLKNEKTAKEKGRVELQRELAAVQQKEAGSGSALETWQSTEREKKIALDQCAAALAETEKRIHELAQRIGHWERVKNEQEEKLGQLRQKHQDARSRISSLETLQKNYEGYQDGVRAIMLKRREDAAPDGICGLVADVIESPETLEKALTAVLGERIQYIIVQSHDEGLEAIDYLKRESSGRGTFIPREFQKKQQRPLLVSEPEVVGPLLESVSVREGYSEIAEFLIGDVVVVRDLKSGLDLWRRNGFSNTLVTLEGEVIDPMGVVSGGSLQSLDGGVLSQRRSLRELQTVMPQIETDLQEAEAVLAGIKRAAEETESQKVGCGQESRRFELERVRLEHEILEAGREIVRAREGLDLLAEERNELSGALSGLEQSMAELDREVERRSREKSERETSLEAKQTVWARVGNDLTEVEGVVTESRMRSVALVEKKQSANSTLERQVQFRQELLNQIRTRNFEIERAIEKRKELEATIERTRDFLAQEADSLKEKERALDAKRADYRQRSRTLAEIEETVKEIRSGVEETQLEKNRRQLVSSEKKLRHQHLLQTILEKYGVELASFPGGEDLSPAVAEELSLEIEELRHRLDRMGDVNLAAIGEYDDLQSRYQFLVQQKEDLEKSIADLRQTITKLNRTCRLHFRESFDQINEKFEAVFPRLFRGGKARLVLTDENDYLETGVDIVAQPPGKKLQSITLLSGGEKALTAVSLLFAIFLTKPTPFCVLDEVDAPLDDANIDRFNDSVKEMSQSSQFILITHNKRTMQAAELLYGVTMAEPGVSKVVSVKMS
ncbi:MAG: chromosome segregation protein SMC [Candidatus Binatia bacterium]